LFVGTFVLLLLLGSNLVTFNILLNGKFI
jgi:hypothetical protein